MNILIVKLSAIGDVIHTLPSLSALRRLYPQVSLSFVGSVGGFERPLLKETQVQFATYDEVRAGPMADSL